MGDRVKAVNMDSDDNDDDDDDIILLEVLLKPGAPYLSLSQSATPVLTRGGYNPPKQKTNDNTQHTKS
jgi:hypothetical protein